jgi:hypothetical protein
VAVHAAGQPIVIPGELPQRGNLMDVLVPRHAGATLAPLS